MIVGVESNFVLELTFLQEEAAPCARILDLAERKAIQLAIPACALFEPYETLIRRTRERERVARELDGELRQLARTDTYAELCNTLDAVARVLVDSCKEQKQSLANTISRIVSIATVIPLTDAVIQRSLEVQVTYRLPPQDSVVFASLDQFFEQQEKCAKLFANRNRRDFATNALEEQLAKYDCKFLPRFAQACDYIEATLQRR
jgi:predicted nucleic acid-binding protein